MRKKLPILLLMCVMLLALICGCKPKAEKQAEYTGIISAMDNEIDLLLEEAEIDHVDTIADVEYHIGSLHGEPVVITRAGIGKIRAASGVTTMLMKLHDFWATAGLPVWLEGHAPDAQAAPYLLYTAGKGDFGEPSAVTATADKVLSGASFVDAGGNTVGGTMPDNGSVECSIDGLDTVSVTIPEGYTAGGTVRLTDDIESALSEI